MARTPNCLRVYLHRSRLIRQVHGVRILPILPSRLLTPRLLVIPWGRFGTLRKDIELAGKAKSEGGTGRGEEFFAWSEKQVQSYL